MAKRKDLKQDIKQLVDEVVVDCLQYMKANPNQDEGKVKEIISEILKLRKDLIHRVNHLSENTEAKKVKEHFDAIIKDLLEKTDEAFKKISALPRKWDYVWTSWNLSRPPQLFTTSGNYPCLRRSSVNRPNSPILSLN